VYAFGLAFLVYDEVRLLWIVIIAGALGSLVHALRSVYWYVGNRNLVSSWLAKYMLMPFGGSALAVVFYFVIRGGFFSPQAGVPQTSPFGFAALSATIGLFSEQAVLKLKQVAETIFSKPERGADATPQKDLNKPVASDSQPAQKPPIKPSVP
jgi:phosphatidylglycerophosphate synthase